MSIPKAWLARKYLGRRSSYDKDANIYVHICMIPIQIRRLYSFIIELYPYNIDTCITMLYITILYNYHLLAELFLTHWYQCVTMV